MCSQVLPLRWELHLGAVWIPASRQFQAWRHLQHPASAPGIGAPGRTKRAFAAAAARRAASGPSTLDAAPLIGMRRTLRQPAAMETTAVAAVEARSHWLCSVRASRHNLRVHPLGLPQGPCPVIAALAGAPFRPRYSARCSARPNSGRSTVEADTVGEVGHRTFASSASTVSLLLRLVSAPLLRSQDAPEQHARPRNRQTLAAPPRPRMQLDGGHAPAARCDCNARCTPYKRKAVPTQRESQRAASLSGCLPPPAMRFPPSSGTP